MNILITGGTGFIGSYLCDHLLKRECNIVVITRYPDKVKPGIKGITNLDQIAGRMDFDVVINLAGEPIANSRLCAAQIYRISDSRLDTTKRLINFFKLSKNKPKLFISGSAIGYYGVGECNDSFNEDAVGDDSFSSQLCQQWEAVASEAEALGIRTCKLRTGIVLGKGGGALKKMLLPFKLGVGGVIGRGVQWMSWIHIEDLVGVILYCIDHEGVSGAVNGTAPNPVTNKSFTKALGRVLKRPTVFPMPAVIVKLLMGQMGEELLLAGKRVLPVKVTKEGYIFKYAKLDDALLNAV
jgi:uncharacterized protein